MKKSLMCFYFIIFLLISYGCSGYACMKSFISPTTATIISLKDWKLAQFINNINADSVNNLTILTMAIRQNNLEIIKILVEREKDIVNAKDEAGNTPLHIASQYGALEIAEFLIIEKNADVNAGSKLQLTPLYWAADAEMAELLLKHGADPNARDMYGYTLLHLAGVVRVGNVFFMTPNPQFRTIEQKNVEIIQLLIAYGANPNTRDKEGKTPLDWAKKRRHSELAELLKKHGAVD